MKKHIIYIVFITLLSQPIFAQKEQSTTLRKKQGIENLIDLKKDLNSFLKERHIPGAMVSIVTSDTVIFAGGFGFADLEKREAVSAGHLFRLGSISKSITSLGLIKLLSETGYTLDTPIRDIVPNDAFSNSWSSNTPITIEHLLEHTTGFDDFHTHAIYNRSDSVRPPVRDMVMSHRNSLTSRWEPGVRKAYSNPGYIMAGYVMELLANEPYNEYLKSRVLSPLGMNSSDFYFKKPEGMLFAQGYRYKAGNHVSVGFPSIQGGPAGGFSSNAIEMGHFLQFLLNRSAENIDSTVFSKEIFDRIENSNSTLAGESGLPGGYGYGNYTVWRNGFVFHGHDGGIDGFSSRYLYSRDADIAISVVINREGNATEIAGKILDFFLGEPSEEAKRVTFPIPETLKESHEGFYGFANPRQELFKFSERMLAGISLDFEDDIIIVKSILGKHRDTLYYAGSNMFYKNDEAVPATMLLTSTTGKPVFWINESYTEMESHSLRLLSSISITISMIMPFIFLGYGIIWFVIRAFSKIKKPSRHHLVLTGASLCYTLLFVSFGMAMSDVSTAGMVTFQSVLLFISSLLFIPSVIATIVLWFKPFTGKGFRFYYIATSSAMLLMTIFFIQNGFIGLRLWAY
ncbi:serine hydrolase [Roseivirga sp. E12]|uniref:serine hydrolase domain-containing protein n=1 Tax=Roseivirga sp. E12 TaxID=2819237 RepID=UPI001ABC79A7|nr:serine hydrolase domain-containing protein [Roseivirga sp. E12]MBO3700272.1 beta-lactamase family protein [Roseivirga sp. E12]